MLGFLFKSSSWRLVRDSDFFTWVILACLFAASVFCIAIVALKTMFFNRELKRMQAMLLRARNIRSLDDFVILKEDFKHNVGGMFLSEGLEELKILLSIEGQTSEQKVHRFDVSLNQFSDDSLLGAESYLPILGVSAAVSPLMGLFGTIWGLIQSFVSIGTEKSADLAVVAPGIAMALVTTLAGLIVAIPAMIFFHYFSNQLRKLEQLMGHLSDKFFSVASNAFSRADFDNMTTLDQSTKNQEL